MKQAEAYEKPRVFWKDGEWRVTDGITDFGCDTWDEAIDFAITMREDMIDDRLRYRRFLEHCEISNDMRLDMNTDDPEEPVPPIINPERIDLNKFVYFISFT